MPDQSLSAVPFSEHYLVRAGVHGYGLEDAESDLDIRGFYFHDDPKAVLGFIKYPERWNGAGDCTLWEASHFFRLAASANPNVIETLFVDPEDILMVTPLAQKIVDNREKFLSKKIAKTCVGYAATCAERLKARWDAKDASHLMRLCFMGVEAVRTGKLNVKRTGSEKDFLIGVKRGSIMIPDIAKFFESSKAEIKEALSKSPLPDEPDMDALNQLLTDVMKEHFA